MGRWVHTKVLDDGLQHPAWGQLGSSAAHFNVSNLHSHDAARPPPRCAAALRVVLPARQHFSLRTEAPLTGVALSVQARLLLSSAVACERRPLPVKPPSAGWQCEAPICLSLRRSADGDGAARFLPLCSMGSVSPNKWSKLSADAAIFFPGSSRRAGAAAVALDEIVFLAGSAPVHFAVESLLILSSGTPPPTLPFPAAPAIPTTRTSPTPGWCQYLSSEYGREPRAPKHAPSAPVPKAHNSAPGAPSSLGISSSAVTRSGLSRKKSVSGGGTARPTLGLPLPPEDVHKAAATKAHTSHKTHRHKQSKQGGTASDVRRRLEQATASAVKARTMRTPLRLCAMDGDHLLGRWVRNCQPSLIRQPERYAYGAPLGWTNGSWDYRLCSRMSYSERVRAREALSWSWVPRHCQLRRINGSEFGPWLGARTLLVWGDSLSAQAYFSLLALLGAEVIAVTDLGTTEEFLRFVGMMGSGGQQQAEVAGHGSGTLSGAAGAALGAPSEGLLGVRTSGSMCSYGGLGEEGGLITVAQLRSGGVLIKLLGHAPMVEELGRPLTEIQAGAAGEPAWWESLLNLADLFVFNVGHHYRAIDSRYANYTELVANGLTRLAKRLKPNAQLIFRTSNLGHVACERSAAPLHHRSDAWRSLGGWTWRPPTFQPKYFGQPREGEPDIYDWRAPALHEGAWLKAAAAVGGTFPERFTVLNVSHVDLRADGHVAKAMAAHSDPAKATKGADCLHYCLPGPADAWAHALVNLLLNNERYAHKIPN